MLVKLYLKNSPLISIGGLFFQHCQINGCCPGDVGRGGRAQSRQPRQSCRCLVAGALYLVDPDAYLHIVIYALSPGRVENHLRQLPFVQVAEHLLEYSLGR